MLYPDKLKTGGRVYPIKYLKALKKTSSIRIREGQIVLRLSRFTFPAQRDEIIQKFLKWAKKKISKVSEKSVIEPVYRDNGRICVHNKIYEIKTVFDDRETTKVIYKENEGVIEISMNKKIDQEEVRKQIKSLTEKIIMKDQIPYLSEVIHELNQMYFQEKYNNVKFKRSSSRFGSCSSKRNINIAYRLLFAPREVFRYVCAHELAHLKEMNHSRRFWDLVEGAMPEYKKCEKWLKSNGLMLG